MEYFKQRTLVIINCRCNYHNAVPQKRNAEIFQIIVPTKVPLNNKGDGRDDDYDDNEYLC